MTSRSINNPANFLSWHFRSSQAPAAARALMVMRSIFAVAQLFVFQAQAFSQHGPEHKVCLNTAITLTKQRSLFLDLKLQLETI